MRLFIDAEVDEGMWLTICCRVRATSPPAWMLPLLSTSLAALKAGTPADVSRVAGVEAIFMPIDQDYLEFLHTQIRLNARGDEWSAILRIRLHRLQPFVNTELFRLFVTRDDPEATEHLAEWYLAPPDWRVIHHECA